MQKEPGVSNGSAPLQGHDYRLHSRIRILAVVFIVYVLAAEIFLAVQMPDQPYSGARLNGLTVARVDSGSPADRAGLRKGDRIIAVAGTTCTGSSSYSRCIAAAGPGQTVDYEISRQGFILRLPVKMSDMPLKEVARKASLLAVGFSFMAIGLLVYFKRTDKLALVFYLLCLAFGIALVNIANPEPRAGWHIYKPVLNDIALLSLPPLFLHFFLIWPKPSRLLKERPRLAYFIYIPMVALLLVSAALHLADFAYDRYYPAAQSGLLSATALYFICCVLMGLTAFVASYRRVRSGSARSKLRLVVWGTLAGTLPLIVIQVILSIRPALEVPGERLAFLPLILVPVAFGHAIVRYGLLDLRIVFRRGLVYTLLTAVLASVYFAVVYGIGRIASRFMGSADLLFSILSIFVITLLISPLRARIRSVVDRTFFRDEYNYRRVVKEMSRSLTGIVNPESLISYLCIRVSQVLNARSSVVYVRDGLTGKYTARYGVQVDHSMLKAFDGEGTLATYLRQARSPLNVERKIASNRPLPLSPDETDALGTVGASLVVPFIRKSQLLGFICVGPKRDADFYTSRDLELLDTLADHASLAIENARLYVETVEKQKMERELEVAREIQHHLLPKSFPGIPGLEIGAVNKPSKHVGGDYYDVIALSPSRIGVVIGDVSGKGVPAALLMASLQSSLRGEAAPEVSPASLISSLNRVIYKQTSAVAFVTIFYGVIDFEARTITYCNAGHSPPLILRADLTSVMLDQTDMVIGIDPDAPYRNNQVRLHLNDLLFLYTDGITDELNDKDEPFGESRLLEELRRGHGLPVSDIVRRVHDAVVGHTAGSVQDDVTALAIRVDSFGTFDEDSNPGKKQLKTIDSLPDK
jgi:sigma-B regulation protein RsbU (phosphoserine phosphatase)